jgi:CRISPR/Cas system CMR-associated protein Cmr3 (group 5 of RAMP superfamily)
MDRYQKLLQEKENLSKKISINEARLTRDLNSRTERKKRTHRLIQKGALLEKYFEIEDFSIQDTEEILKIFSDYVKANIPDKFKRKEGQ